MGKLVKVSKNILLSSAVLIGFALLGLSLPIGGRQPLAVQSGSMEPAIKTGSLVFVESVPAENIKPGDVITYINPSNDKQTITHRVQEVTTGVYGNKQFITKGDANAVADKPIGEKRVVGRVGLSVPYLGYATGFIRQPLGLALVIWLPVLWIVFGETRRLADYYRRIRPYLAPGAASHVFRRNKKVNAVPYLVLTAAVGILSLGVAVPVLALYRDSVTLTGNTFTVAPVEEPEEPEPPQPPPTNGGGTTVTCTDNTNVNVNSTNNQSAASGNASSNNNTSGGNAQSGNASNNSSSSVNINVNNGTCVPPATASDTPAAATAPNQTPNQ